MNTELMFSSKTDKWATPQWFFDEMAIKRLAFGQKNATKNHLNLTPQWYF